MASVVTIGIFPLAVLYIYDLGVILNIKLSWHNHVDKMLKKCS